MNPKVIIISRTDSIGDVMLTLPMCGILRQKFPGVRIIFLAKAYTKAIIDTCEHVDEYLDWDEMSGHSPQAQIDILKSTNADTIIHVFPRKEILWLSKRAAIAQRIATAHRLYTIGKCNKLVFFSRRKSNLHESQLNLKLLRPLGILEEFSLKELSTFYGFRKIDNLAAKKVDEYLNTLDNSKRRIVLHPLSRGSAAEWSLRDYSQLISMIPPDQYEVFVTGTEGEGEKMRKVISLESVHDITGRFSLAELIAFISKCDILVAASTGPLHIAAALGIKAIGLYSPKRPIHPGRWAPLGIRAVTITATEHPSSGQSLGISPDEVLKEILVS